MISLIAAAIQRRASVCGSAGTAAPAASVTRGDGASARLPPPPSCRPLTSRTGGSTSNGSHTVPVRSRNASCVTRDRSTSTSTPVSTTVAAATSMTSRVPRFQSSFAAR